MQITNKYRKYRKNLPRTPSIDNIHQLIELFNQFENLSAASYFFYQLGTAIGAKLLSENSAEISGPDDLVSTAIPAVKIRVEELVVEKRYVCNFSLTGLEDSGLPHFPVCCLVRGILESYISTMRRNAFHAYESIIIQNDHHCSHRIFSERGQKRVSKHGGDEE